MKKFYNKINNKQWRMTVPNTFFKKNSKSPEVDEAKGVTGFYDVQEAQKEYAKSGSVPNSVYFLENSGEDQTKLFADLTNDYENDNGSDDERVYMDVDIVKKDASPSSADNQEYDVPRISFKFFEKKEKEEYCDNMYENIKDDSSQKEGSYTAQATNFEIADVTPYIPRPRLKNEIKIVLTAVEIDISEENYEKNEIQPTVARRFDRSKSKSLSQEFISSTSITLTNENEELPGTMLRKYDSDPNIKNDKDDDDEENFYKIPRSLTQKRYSQSLKDFDVVDLTSRRPANISTSTSIEHISCSQIIATLNSEENTDESEYTKARCRFPRLTLLKKPHNKWHDWKSKFNNLMIEQARRQRVGAFDDKPKMTINVEEVYRNSKSKCRNMIRNTGKLFNRRKNPNDADVSSNVSKNSTPTAARTTELKASDIEYQLNISDRSDSRNSEREIGNKEEKSMGLLSKSTGDFGTIRSAFGKLKSAAPVEGQNGFEDLRRYVKQGSDFCKELTTILQDRAEAEAVYAKSLSKLSSKLSRACREGVGTLNEGWKAVALELEARAESHRLLGVALLEESAKPLRTMTENQQKSRKQAENAVDKASKSLGEWRASEAKSKKNSHTCARENEKLQDAALLDNSRLSRSTSLIHLGNMQKNTTDKENAKLEGKKRKAEDAVKKADIEYYTLCVRAERARLEWESAVLRGVGTFQSLEEERLNNLKQSLISYLQHSNDHLPRIIEATERLKIPVAQSESSKDLTTFVNLRQTSQQISEQLLPDFYCEHITLAMNRERRKQALIKLLHLVRQDIERERKSKIGLENLSKAIKQTPNFGAEDSQQSVTEKLYHMKSMLTYLEAARYKVQNALAELDSRPRSGHPLAPHITITRDKSGLQQSVLKVPQWLREEWTECERSPVSEKSVKSGKSSENEDPQDWTDRGAADGNSNQPDSDFDEFSSQCSSVGDIKCTQDENVVQPIAQCKAIYPYTPNLNDELSLKPGDILSVYRQQDDGWWLGECDGNVGIFPATYVEIIPT